jgi:5'-phosphate synthase pdxT subunit
VDSFEADIPVPVIGEQLFHAVFIRAPVVESVGPEVEVLATVREERTGDETPVAVRQVHIMATSFHPELTDDRRMHSYFLEMVREANRSSSPK